MADVEGVIGEDPLATALPERADLERPVLVKGGHSGAADSHVVVTLENSAALDCVNATLIISRKECVCAHEGVSSRDVAVRVLSATSLGDVGLAKVKGVNRDIVLMWILPGLLLAHRLPPEKLLQ